MIDYIQSETARCFGLVPNELSSKKREEKILLARDVAMYLCYELLEEPAYEIGRAFNEDSTQVIFHIKKLMEYIDKIPSISKKIDTIARNLYWILNNELKIIDENIESNKNIIKQRQEVLANIVNLLSKNLLESPKNGKELKKQEKIPTAKPIRSSQAQLEEFIGFEENKVLARKFVNSFLHQKMRKDLRLKTNKTSMHMVFTGNAGTGKTTFARIIGKIFKEEGILSKGDFIEVGRSDLVGEYVGQTAPKVIEVFEQAKGSVLFIDESYSLLSDDSYSQEAIATIVQEMENNREDTVVIFAGYKLATEQMLASNDGLKSRIAFTLDFPDYKPEELIKITQMMVQKLEYQLSDDVVQVLEDFFKKTKFDEKSGNARMVRNILEKAIINQADRIQENLRANADLSISKEELLLLELEDFEEVLSGFVRKNVSEDVVIGFRQPRHSVSTYRGAEELPLKEVAVSR